MVDVATNIERGRHLTYNAAWLKDQAGLFTKDSAMASLSYWGFDVSAAESAVSVTGG